MKYISSKPDIVGGAPVIAGTRMLISRVLFLLKEGYPLEEIHKMYPHVSVETLDRAINEYIEHMDELHAKKTPAI